MNYIYEYIHLILHINTLLPYLFHTYGDWIYAIVFLIVFLESGLILTPFLPGESMLFALGAVTAVGNVTPHIMVLFLVTAAILGGFVNYVIGNFIGQKILAKTKSDFFKKSMTRTEEFYDKYGVLAILLARFVPIIRTFVPFFAGMVRMPFRVFALFNSLGGVLWITIFIYMGYFFGRVPYVQEHFSWFVMGIIILSIVPISIELIKALRQKQHEKSV